ncbi:MAG: lipoyl synthase [Bacteroidetes bacterium]|nr:lipoyl synthase [Bacteroidales bacterium]NJO69271.1 lipoyl synthase [Bacteroidota bacterium]
MDNIHYIENRERLPRWMKSPLPAGEKYSRVRNLIREDNLHTICTSGNCPNKGECWSAGTASFMILGDKCTRDCKFCQVKTLLPDPVDWEEPQRLANTIKKLQLKHCVITSVARDDIEDGGARFWALTIRTIKRINPGTTMEVLIPDFHGRFELIQKIITEGPEVISHNIETVKRLSPKIRNMFTYRQSLEVLRYISKSGIVTKSGFMLGLGETESEILETINELRLTGVNVLTIGQYLRPSQQHAEVVNYIHPEKFDEYRIYALSKGFTHVESGPLVRSSYHAERHVNTVNSEVSL